MTDKERLGNPGFQRHMRRRSGLRWGLTVFLVTAYLGWSLGGLYFPDAYGTGFLGSAIPWGIVAGYAIIAVSIGLSLFYVGRINRMSATRDD